MEYLAKAPVANNVLPDCHLLADCSCLWLAASVCVQLSTLLKDLNYLFQLCLTPTVCASTGVYIA